MTTNNLYTMTLDTIKEYAKVRDFNEEFYTNFEQNPHQYKEHFDPIIKNSAKIIIDCLEKMDKKKGSNMAALKRIMKDAIKKSVPGQFDGVFENDGMYCLLDGHRIIRLKEDISSFPHIEKDKFDTKRLYPDKYAMHKTDLPELVDLKAAIARNKANKEIKPFIQDDYIGYNPQFMLDAIEALDNPILYLPEKNNMPILIEGDNGDAIVLPIRIFDTVKAYSDMEKDVA